MLPILEAATQEGNIPMTSLDSAFAIANKQGKTEFAKSLIARINRLAEEFPKLQPTD